MGPYSHVQLTLKENDLVNCGQTVQLILLRFRQLDYTTLILLNSPYNPLM